MTLSTLLNLLLVLFILFFFGNELGKKGATPRIIYTLWGKLLLFILILSFTSIQMIEIEQTGVTLLVFSFVNVNKEKKFSKTQEHSLLIVKNFFSYRIGSYENYIFINYNNFGFFVFYAISISFNKAYTFYWFSSLIKGKIANSFVIKFAQMLFVRDFIKTLINLIKGKPFVLSFLEILKYISIFLISCYITPYIILSTLYLSTDLSALIFQLMHDAPWAGGRAVGEFFKDYNRFCFARYHEYYRYSRHLFNASFRDRLLYMPCENFTATVCYFLNDLWIPFFDNFKEVAKQISSYIYNYFFTSNLPSQPLDLAGAVEEDIFEVSTESKNKSFSWGPWLLTAGIAVACIIIKPWLGF